MKHQHLLTCSSRAQDNLQCPQGRPSFKHCKISKGFAEYISSVVKLLSLKLPVRGYWGVRVKTCLCPFKGVLHFNVLVFLFSFRLKTKFSGFFFFTLFLPKLHVQSKSLNHICEPYLNANKYWTYSSLKKCQLSDTV